MGKRQNNGNRLVQFCELNELSIDGTIFNHKNIDEESWRSSAKNTEIKSTIY